MGLRFKGRKFGGGGCSLIFLFGLGQSIGRVEAVGSKIVKMRKKMENETKKRSKLA